MGESGRPRHTWNVEISLVQIQPSRPVDTQKNVCIIKTRRGVAQPVRAGRLGRSGRRLESSRPDTIYVSIN